MTESDDLADLLQRWEDEFDRGRDVPVEELCRDCPELAAAAAEAIAALKRAKEFAEWSDGSAEGGPSSAAPTASRGAGALTLAVGAEPLPGYRLVRRVGAGAFGEVWAAESRDWGPVAVKFFHGSLDAAADRWRAERELEGLARIKKVSHPALLRIYHLEVRGTTLVLVTELAKESLQAHFRRLRRRHHPPVRLAAYALSLLRSAAEALDFMHAEHRLFHLDIKPDNLLLVSERCVLGDFGTVSQVGPGRRPGPGVALYDPDTSTTVVYRSCAEVPWGQALRPGATLFTAPGAFSPYYAPPEASLGSSRSFDQYSLALTWCELVTGTIPFRGERDEQMAQRRAGAPELGDWPEAVRPVLRRALSARPEERYPSCVAFVEAACAALRPLAAGSAFAEDLLREGAEGSGSHRVPRLKEQPKCSRWKKAIWHRVRAVPSGLLALPGMPFSLAGAGLRCLGRACLRWGQNPAGWARTHLVLAIPLALAALLAFTFALWAQRLGPLTHPAPRPEQKQEQEPASQPKPKAPEAPLRLPKTLRSLIARPS
ncbi:MAG TPA: protein kinase [Gemmataceae bacterium]|jgi:serine/threonine protein kinase|nr:protein kinase [Gemmataceae bacterium]